MSDTQDKPLVLIVEDDPDLQKILRLQVDHLGCRTEVANNGRDGFRMAKELQPDLLMLDLMMPEMDGFQVLKRVKCISSLENTPVVILTASHDEHHRRKGLSHMADGFMTKPYRLEELKETLESLLKRQLIP